MAVKLNTNYLDGFVNKHELDMICPTVATAHELLHSGKGAGSDFLGWLNLPTNYDKEEYARIKTAAAKIKSDSDVLIVVGIGGSYLGARAVIEAVQGANYNAVTEGVKVYFAGNNISGAYLNDILKICEGKEVSVNVISKSGTTTEPALAFRVFKDYMEKRYGKDGAKSRIYATTDGKRGTLKTLADSEGYESFVIPDDVGGRFSVLTAVGLLPVAVAGVDTDALLSGAKAAEDKFSVCEDNDCYKYAAYRNILLRKGKTVELMACFEPDFTLMNEWYKQLFGESEGKDKKGIMPTSVIYSTDLHSMGQYVQDGSRILFETFVDFKEPRGDRFIEADANNGDGLNFLSGQNMSLVNRKAMMGTILAHNDGGVPVLVLEADACDAANIGYLIYFYEKACAVSGYLLSVNPFDQPGVEDYKKNMFALLGKPGYEDLKAELTARLEK